MQAPEVLRGDKATTASDVYSFGMVRCTACKRSVRCHSAQELTWVCLAVCACLSRSTSNGAGTV